jgi:hypothetical protein
MNKNTQSIETRPITTRRTAKPEPIAKNPLSTRVTNPLLVAAAAGEAWGRVG